MFAVSRDGVVDNNLLVQLATTKEGNLGGTVLNQATGESFDIEGTVDKKSQRAVWTYVDGAGKQIVMETSVFNLTQPESTAMIHYAPDDIQVVQLVRLGAAQCRRRRRRFANGAAVANGVPPTVEVAKPAAPADAAGDSRANAATGPVADSATAPVKAAE